MIDAPPMKVRARKPPKPREAEIQTAIVHSLLGAGLVVVVDPWRAKHPPGMKRTAATERMVDENRAKLIKQAFGIASERYGRTRRPVGVMHRNNTGARMLPGGGPDKLQLVKWGMIGSGDLVGVIWPTGQRFELESKRPGEHPSKAQQAWGESMQKAGGYWACVHSPAEAVAAMRQFLEEAHGIARLMHEALERED